MLVLRQMSLKWIRTGTQPGKHVKVDPDLGAVMDLVLVDAKKHDEHLATNIELVVNAFFLPPRQRKLDDGTKRLLMDLLHPGQLPVDRLDFTQDA